MSVSTNARCEPNLTPLLDMVLQLVMFFMLCANFVMEQVDESIKLPESAAAKPLDRKVDDYVVLNVDSKGFTSINDQKNLSPVGVQQYLKVQFELDKSRAIQRNRLKEWEEGKGRSTIIIRAHKDCVYGQVDAVITPCRAVGYGDIQLRAIVSDGIGGSQSGR